MGGDSIVSGAQISRHESSQGTSGTPNPIDLDLDHLAEVNGFIEGGNFKIH